MRYFIPTLFSLLLAPLLFAASVVPLSLEDRAATSGAIARGTVETVVSFLDEDDRIYTAATFTIHETFKGRFPDRLVLRYRGGLIEGRGETITEMPTFVPGEDRLLFLSIHHDGRLVTVGGPDGAPRLLSETGKNGARPMSDTTPLNQLRELYPKREAGDDLSVFAAGSSPTGGYSVASDPMVSAVPPLGISQPERRFILPDRGEPLRYLVDADSLPTGISLPTALEAVENAFAAWADVSSATFEFEGVQSFGTAATNVDINDGRIRIQLHDNYNAIGSSNVLGIGGQSFTWRDNFGSQNNPGGWGGIVDGLPFHRSTRGFVVLKHTAASMQNPVTFEEVLTHEVGHVLGLAHSSETPNESDPYLSEAIMYYTVKADGRGATLADWDIDTIARVHPLEAPPFGFDRMIRAVTSFQPLTNPAVNQVEARGYSLHGDEITTELLFPTSSNGSFSLSNSILTYTPSAAFGDSPEFDPAGISAYDRAYVRFSDEVNQSAPVEVRVIQFLLSTQPAGAPDGLPDSWRAAHFGSSTPVAGLSGAHDDPDGDGLTNLQEFRLGTDPLDPNSRLKVTAVDATSITFQARPFEVYQLHGSTDLINWTAFPRAVLPASTTGEISLPTSEESREFFKIEWVP